MRAIGAAVEMNWLHQSPYYYLDHKGHLKRNKNFSEGRPVTTFFYRLIAKTGILRKLQRNIPRVKKAHKKLTCKILSSIKEQYLKSFPESKFIIAVLGVEPEYDLSPCFKEQNLESILITLDQKPSPGPYEAPLVLPDGHYSALGNKLLAQKILSALRQKRLIAP